MRRENILQTLELMQESLQETLRETREIRRTAIQEEILIEVGNIDQICNNALHYARKAEGLLKHGSVSPKNLR